MDIIINHYNELHVYCLPPWILQTPRNFHSSGCNMCKKSQLSLHGCRQDLRQNQNKSCGYDTCDEGADHAKVSRVPLARTTSSLAAHHLEISPSARGGGNLMG
jgi:hypothetical protein